jgi:hypothetical protein
MIAEHLVHALACVALRVLPPRKALRAVRISARAMPALWRNRDAEQIGRTLAGRGTCLSRAVAIAALAPNIEIVIGVAPDSRTLRAHAWVERAGIPLTGQIEEFTEIARLSSDVASMANHWHNC